MDFCVICSFLLLIMATQGLSIQSTDYGNVVPGMKSILETVLYGEKYKNYERHERRVFETEENHLLIKGRERRMRRNLSGFREQFVAAWNAFLLWLKNSWSKIAEYFGSLKI